MKNDNFFVGITSAKDLRRNILESSKAVVRILQAQQKVMILRNAKMAEMDNLKENIRQLSTLLTRLNEYMPESGLYQAEKKLSGKVKKAMTDDKELKVLESELSEIEKKLKSIA